MIGANRVLTCSSILFFSAPCIAGSYDISKPFPIPAPAGHDIIVTSATGYDYGVLALGKSGFKFEKENKVIQNAINKTFEVSVPGAEAIAHVDSHFSIAADHSTTGFLHISGSATAESPDGLFSSSAMSATYSVLSVGITNGLEVDSKSNHLTLARFVNSVGPVFANDPFLYNMNNLDTGENFSGLIYEIDASIDSGIGNLSFENGILSLSGAAGFSGSFSMDFTNQYLSQQGSAYIHFTNGIITDANGSGVFLDGLPDVGGKVGVYDFSVPAFVFEIPALAGASIGGEFSDSASGYAAAEAPEPGVWAMMLLGFGLVGGGLRRRRAFEHAM